MIKDAVHGIKVMDANHRVDFKIVHARRGEVAGAQNQRVLVVHHLGVAKVRVASLRARSSEQSDSRVC